MHEETDLISAAEKALSPLDPNEVAVPHPIEGAHTFRVTDGSAMNITPPKPQERKDHILSPGSIRKFALAVSKKKRAGKFHRVSEEFIVACQAEFEGKLRGLVNTLDVEAVTKLVPVDGMKFVTKLARDKAAAKLEELAIAIVHGKVCRHPSIGKTLKD